MASLIIFDLDGTLLDSIDDIASSMNKILSDYNLPQHSREAYCHFLGDGARILTQRSVPENVRDTELMEDVLRDFTAFYDIHKTDKTKPFEGMPETLEQLQLNGINLAVATNKPHHLVPDMMKFYYPTISFGSIMGNRNGCPVKPDPKIVYDILREQETEKENTLYVGDTAVDIETAKNAGLKSIGALWGFRTEEELKNAGADFLIDYPTELLHIALEN